MTRFPTPRLSLLVAALTMPLLSLRAEESTAPRDLLRDGLYAEEVSRNAEEAAASYEKILRLHEEQQLFAATALFRLAEVRRKQERKDEAIRLYQRLIREFPQAEAELKLARGHLAALGAEPVEAETGAPGPTMLASLQQLAKTSPDRLSDPQLFIDAIRKGEAESITYLLETAGAPDTIALLPVAVASGSLETVNLLIKTGIKPHSPGENMALLKAAALGHLHIAKALIAAGADINWSSDQSALALYRAADQPERPVGTPLMEAIAAGQTKMVDLLLEAKADVKAAAAGSGFTPLHLAAGLGDTGLVERLLQAGADPNALSRLAPTASSPWGIEKPISALDFGFIKGATKACEPIRKAGGKIHDPDLLGEAVKNAAESFSHDAFERVELILSLGADPNAQYEGGPILFFAKSPVAQLLLDAGADPNVRKGREALLLKACLSNEWGVAEKLLEKGADPDPSPGVGDSPLIIAASQFSGSGVLKKLVKKGAKPDARWLNENFRIILKPASTEAQSPPSPGTPQPGGNRRASLHARPELFREFVVQTIERRDEVRWVYHTTTYSDIAVLCPKTPSAAPPPLLKALLDRPMPWTDQNPSDPLRLRFILWRETPEGGRRGIEFGIEDPAAIPPLQWGDILESAVAPPGDTSSPVRRRTAGAVINSASWLLRKDLSFGITIEQGNKNRRYRINGSRLADDPSTDELPYVGARALAAIATYRDEPWRSDDHVLVKREGWPEIKLPLNADGRDFPVEAGDHVKLVIHEPEEDKNREARMERVHVVSPGSRFRRDFRSPSRWSTGWSQADAVPTLLQLIVELEGSNQKTLKDAPEDPTLLAPWLCDLQQEHKAILTTFSHPDLSRIVIHRLKDVGSDEKIPVDLSAALEAANESLSAEAARNFDVPLKAGDIVEIPVRSPLPDEPWKGFGPREQLLFSKALDAQIQYTDQENQLSVRQIRYQPPRYVQAGASWIPLPPQEGTSTFIAEGALGIDAAVKVTAGSGSSWDSPTRSIFLKDGLRIQWIGKSPLQLPGAR